MKLGQSIVDQSVLSALIVSRYQDKAQKHFRTRFLVYVVQMILNIAMIMGQSFGGPTYSIYFAIIGALYTHVNLAYFELP
jgi:hypothetical protein